jgi:RHS repeat-associated protein
MDTDGYQFANPIDNLTYLYDTDNKNQLLRVFDATANMQGFKDDTNGTSIATEITQAPDYGYDANGNMNRDDNKGIQSIIYNHLNLPTKITFANPNNITYLYNATGQKVNKVVTEKIGTQNIITTTDYLNGYQYVNDVMQFFPHAEGYVKVTGTSYDYVYNYTDHLGNIRLSYSKEPASNALKVIEENHYYPFGLKHTGYNSDRFVIEISPVLPRPGKATGWRPVLEEIEFIPYNPANFNASLNYDIKFQGQERQDELGLNWDSFKWRNYDYAIGRFMSIDPLAEKYSYNGTYNFSENRVIDGRELEGLEWANIKNDDGTSTRQLTVQLVNNSKLKDNNLLKLTNQIQTDFAKSYSGEGSNAKLIIENISDSDGSCDFLVQLIDTKSNSIYDKNTGEIIGITWEGGQTGILGQTQKNNFDVTASVDGVKKSISIMSRSFLHEAGHTAGLQHPWLASNPVTDIIQGAVGVKDSTVRSNLMNSDDNKINPSTSGTTLTSGQLKSIDQTIKNQEIKTP